MLREWRARRGFTQLDVSLASGISVRHLSFIETGRVRPAKVTLLTIADTLDIPLRERNRLLEAAGLAAAYAQTSLEASEMAHLREVLQLILNKHEPFAAIVLDRYATCLMSNSAAARLIRALCDSSLLVGGKLNHLRVIFHPQGVRRFIVNWDEVSRHALERAERELTRFADDAPAAELLAELRSYVPRSPPAFRTDVQPADLLLPVHIRKGDIDLRIYSAIMTLGEPRDVLLQELRIETFFPADASSQVMWERLLTTES
jgi:transcriptional regulator with XRE-family HTH domain